jgi:hypothetical protein
MTIWKTPLKKTLLKALALLLAMCLLPVGAMGEEQTEETDNNGWVNFLLLCNEGMNNNGGNAGNTMMVVAMHPERGKIRLAMLTWDTFVRYEGYDMPQRIDMPYRNGGPAEALKVFNANFGLDIDLFMSLNYLNLASLIDAYGGVTVDVSRAERNALNGMVASKKENIQAQADSGLLSQLIVEMLAQEYYLTDFGPDTHLNGLQAVGFGWLQYDSVYNCCYREAEVIAHLFASVANAIGEKVVLYTNETGYPSDLNGRRAINLDAISETDINYLSRQVAPIFQMSYNNLTPEQIIGIYTTLAKVAYPAARQGVNIFASLEHEVFPLEAKQKYDTVAGSQGHLIDYKANSEALKAFLYAEDPEE